MAKMKNRNKKAIIEAIKIHGDDFLNADSKNLKEDFTEVKVVSFEQRQINIRAGRNSFWEYAKMINPEFFREDRPYQKIIANALQMAYEKKLLNLDGKPIDILIINLPPGFGKSYMATTFTTWVYGQNQKNMAITVSYNQTLSSRFAKTVRDTIEEKEVPGIDNYVVNSFFPKVKIKYGDGAMSLWSLEGQYMSYLASSFDGSITGMRGNIGIIDDPIKNKYEAVNTNVKANHWDFYKNTFYSRMLPGALQIIIQTRWATDDLAGKIMEEFPDRVYVLSMKAITDEGLSLCENLYPLEDLLSKKKGIDEDIFEANYQQEPVDLKGQLYSNLKTYENVPRNAAGHPLFTAIKNYTDTADTGKDYLCSIVYGVYMKEAYILDVLYTKKPMEYTEPAVAKMLFENNVNVADIESNNGGRGFARAVERHLKEKLHSNKTRFNWFYQSKNKEARILTNATWVMDHIYFPANWKDKWPEFYMAVMKYQAEGKNANDDAPDTLTGIAEKMGNGKSRYGWN